MDISVLKKIGFPDKSADVYLALLQLGPSSVRNLAEFCDLNRGSTYDALKWLQDRELVTFYKKASKQHFVVEHPEKLKQLVEKEQEGLVSAQKEIDRSMSELLAVYNAGGDRPVARYFTTDTIAQILTDVLDTCEEADELMYRVYSVEGLREQLYKDFPTFSDARIGKGIAVRAIAMGQGGELRGLDERKYIKAAVATPTYIIIYPGKTAYISLNAKSEAVGVVIENAGVYETQKVIFDTLWETL